MTAAMAPPDQIWADRLRAAHFPPDRNFLKAHITLFHHLPPSQSGAVRAAVKAMTVQYAPPRADVTRLLNLGRGVAYFIESPDLLGIRAEMAERFHGLLTPQDQARPRLHITIQNKVEPAVARALLSELESNFEPRPLSITGLALHHYLGGPWEPAGTWSFRGQTAAA